MLHRTLLKSGHSEVVHSTGNAAHAAAAKKLIPGTAGYFGRTDLGWVHGHREMNYRKKALGFKAYHKEHMDIWAPFANKAPFRHMETAAPGTWFAAGHLAIHQWGFWKLPLNIKAWLCWGVPFVVGIFAYVFRYAKGGWVEKNKGAVFGFE